MSLDAIHTLLAALDDYEQTMSNGFEETGRPEFLEELDRASVLYAAIDELRFQGAA